MRRGRCGRNVYSFGRAGLTEDESTQTAVVLPKGQTELLTATMAILHSIVFHLLSIRVTRVIKVIP